jgi:cytochrome P450
MRADIYHNDKFFKSRRAYSATQIAPKVYNMFNAINKQMHRRKRRAISHGLSENALRQFEPSIHHHIDTFIFLLNQSCGGPAINMTDKCKNLSLDIIGQFGFGQSLNMQTESTNRFLSRAMDASMYRQNIYMQYPLLKRVGFETVLFLATYFARQRFIGILKRLVVTRLAKDAPTAKDLLAFVREAQNSSPGEETEPQELWTEAALLLVAGKTARFTLCWQRRLS